MAFISDQDREVLRQIFNGLERPVKLIYFGRKFDCDYCETMQDILAELEGISEMVSLVAYDAVEDFEEAEKYGMDLFPGLIVRNEKDYGIRYFGVPGGYEFSALIDVIGEVAKGFTDLSEETKQALKKLENPMTIRVFITLSCPYCPRTVHMAHQMAIESNRVRGEMIEAAEFPHLAQQYHVGAVPKVIINDEIEFEGALTERLFLDYLLQADAVHTA
jgi:glutaredoxin-like protein